MIVSSPLSIHAKQQAAAVASLTSPRHWWQQSVTYVAAAVGTLRQDLPGLIALVGFFQLPPLAAVIIGSRAGTLAFWIAWSLPWITITLAIADLEAGRPMLPAPILLAAMRWLPRYLWTNSLTSILFWGVFTPLQWI